MSTTISPTFIVEDEAIASAQLFLIASAQPASMLAAAITSGATSLTLTDAAAAPVGSGIVIDGEAMLVTAANGAGRTVTRARLGTAAAAHAIDTPVRLQRQPTLLALLRAIVAERIAQIMEWHPGPTVLARRAEIATAQAAIETAKNAAVA